MFLFVFHLWFWEYHPHRLISIKFCVCVRMWVVDWQHQRDDVADLLGDVIAAANVIPSWYFSRLNIWKGAMVGSYIIFLKTSL